MEIIKRSTPEQDKLDKKLSELANPVTFLSWSDTLEVEHCERELELVTLRAELADFERRYLGTLGPLYAELDDLEVQIAEATARSHSGDPAAQQAAAAARAQADQSAHLADRPEFHAAATLKDLFREAAKAMHPDRADQARIHVTRGSGYATFKTCVPTSQRDQVRFGERLRKWIKQ